jgi:ABC-2 type transport system permease protein
MVLAGAIVGSLCNRHLPLWTSTGFLLFIVFNLLLAAGIRDLMVRLFARRRIREIAMFLVVIVAALPQVLLITGAGHRIRSTLAFVPTAFLPWDATAAIAGGHAHWWTPLILLAWIVAAGVFGRYQFARSIGVELESTATETSASIGPERFSFLYTWPARLFAEPLAALIEKEIRILTRSSRFRVVFVMGFTFGLLVWVPMSLGSSHRSDSFIGQNFLTIVSAYAIMLLTDLLFFNSFGPDRGAAQIYFLVPVKLQRVFMAKNAAAMFFVLSQLAIITVVCVLFRLPVTPIHVGETLAVCLVMCEFLLALGNMASVWHPRPMNMAQPFRTQGSRVQWMALVAFPVACIPVTFAYLARFAFDNEAAFFGVLAVFGAAGLYLYSLALETAAHYCEAHREPIIEALSRSSGVISS